MDMYYSSINRQPKRCRKVDRRHKIVMAMQDVVAASTKLVTQRSNESNFVADRRRRIYDSGA
jgi:hypothetical protein